MALPGDLISLDPEEDRMSQFDPMGRTSPGSECPSSPGSTVSDLDGLDFSSDEEFSSPTSRIVLTYNMTRGVVPNSCDVSGPGVKTLFGQVRVPERACKILLGCGYSLDHLHSISPGGIDTVVFGFYFPGERQMHQLFFKCRAEAGYLELSKLVP